MVSLSLSNPSISAQGIARVIGMSALLAIPFAMLVVSPSSFSPFASGKTDVFRWLCMALALYMLTSLKLKPPVWLYGGYIAVLALADFGAENRTIAFWGEAMREDGFISVASYFCFFMALTIIPTTERFWKWLVRGWVISGAIVSLASLLQSLNFYLTYQDVPRAYGLIGNPVFMGDFLGLTILFTLWAAKSSKLWLAALAVQIPVLLMTGSRSAMAGAVIGSLFLIPNKFRWIVLCAGASAAIYIGSSWHVGTLTDLAYRAGCWHTEISAIMQKPWLGYGQENLHVMCAPQMWDRSHNLFLQALADGGIIALLAYLAFLTASLKSVCGKPYALAIFTAYLVMMSVEPESLTSAVPMLTALGWANRQVLA